MFDIPSVCQSVLLPRGFNNHETVKSDYDINNKYQFPSLFKLFLIQIA